MTQSLCVLIRLLIITALVVCSRLDSFSQSDRGLVGEFNFNNAVFRNEITQKKMRGAGFLLVNDRFGNSRSACYLHGSPGSFINLGDDQSLKPEKGTISMWVSVEIIVLGGTGYEFNPIILTKNRQLDSFYEGYTLSIDINNGKLCSATSEGEKLQVRLNSAEPLSKNEWHHLALTYDDAELSLYIDGKLEARVAKNFRSVFSATDSVVIGHSANKKNERFFCGKVDDIRIYNRVLSPSEVHELYLQPDPNRYRIYAKWFFWLLGCCVTVVGAVWIALRRYKKQIKTQQEHNQTLARLNELETLAIRMQMNPHFIFNSLNSLQRYILESDMEKAHNYLSRFSTLLRKVLESSNSENISLYEEMEILNNYVQIEKVRFENSFSFTLQSTVTEPQKIHIPFMLIQPLVENAIWHGLLPKRGEKKLRISFSLKAPNQLLCEVEDNGVGLTNQKAGTGADALKKKSQGLTFIKQRLEILNKVTGITCGIEMKDLRNEKNECEGSRVIVTIPILK